MAAAVPDVPEKDLLEEVGLVEGHAYGLIDARKTKSGGHRLLKIRNPWGKVEWKVEIRLLVLIND